MKKPRPRLAHLETLHATAVYLRASRDTAWIEEVPWRHRLMVSEERPFRYLAAADPSRNKSFLRWLIAWYLDGDFAFEDLRHLRAVLADFEANRSRMPLAQRDIGRYRTSFDLQDALDAFHGRRPGNMDLDALPDAVRAQSRVEASGKDWILLSIEGPEAAAWWGSSTSWCTRHPATFDGYVKRSPLRLLATPTGKIQIHTATSQVMTRRNVPASSEDLAALPVEARRAACRAVAGDIARVENRIAGTLTVDGRVVGRIDQACIALSRSGLLHTLLGTPVPVPTAPFVHYVGVSGSEPRPDGPGVSSWLLASGGTVAVVSVDAEHGLRIVDLSSQGSCEERVYRTPADWRRAGEFDRHQMRLLADLHPQFPDRAMEIAAIVNEDAETLTAIVDGGWTSGSRRLMRRLDVLACALAGGYADGGGLAAMLCDTQWWADLIGTSLTAIFRQDHPVVADILSRCAPRTRKVVAGIRPVVVGTDLLPWSEVSSCKLDVADAAIRAGYFGLSGHESDGRGLFHAKRRLLRRDEQATATSDDLTAALDICARALGEDYRLVQRGYLMSCLPIEERSENLVVRLAGRGHSGFAASVAFDRVGEAASRCLIAEGVPVVLDTETATSRGSAKALATLRRDLWPSGNDDATAPRFGTPAEIAAARFAHRFRVSLLEEGAHRDFRNRFERKLSTAMGQADFVPVAEPSETDVRFDEDFRLVRADWLFGMHLVGLDVSSHYDEQRFRAEIHRNGYDPLACNPSFAEMMEGDPRYHRLTDAALLASLADSKDASFLRAVLHRRARGVAWEDVVEDLFVRAWKAGDLRARNDLIEACRPHILSGWDWADPKGAFYLTYVADSVWADKDDARLGLPATSPVW